MSAATELSTIGHQPLLLTGGARDWDAALLLAWIAVLPSPLLLLLQWQWLWP
jgi:hypothetical protein